MRSSLRITALLLLSVGCLVAVVFAPKAEAATCDRGGSGTCITGSFHTGITYNASGSVTAGFEVFENGLHANDISAFISRVKTCLNNGNCDGATFSGEDVGAAYLVLSMLPDTSKPYSVSNAKNRFDDWSTLVKQYNAAGLVDYNYAPSSWPSNTKGVSDSWGGGYYGYPMTDVVHYTETVTGDTNAIVFKDPDNPSKILYAIRKACANPVGTLNKLKKLDKKPTGSATYVCKADGSAVVSYKFEDADQDGDDTRGYTHLTSKSWDDLATKYSSSDNVTSTTLAGWGWDFHSYAGTNTPTETVSADKTDGTLYAWVYAQDLGPGGDHDFYKVAITSTKIKCNHPPEGNITKIQCVESTGELKVTFKAWDDDDTGTVSAQISYAQYTDGEKWWSPRTSPWVGKDDTTTVTVPADHVNDGTANRIVRLYAYDNIPAPDANGTTNILLDSMEVPDSEKPCAPNQPPKGTISIACHADASATVTYKFSDADGVDNKTNAASLVSSSAPPNDKYKLSSLGSNWDKYTDATSATQNPDLTPAETLETKNIYLYVLDVGPSGDGYYHKVAVMDKNDVWCNRTPPANVCSLGGLTLRDYRRKVPVGTNYEGMVVHIMKDGGGYNRYPAGTANVADKFYSFETLGDPQPDWQSVEYRIYTIYSGSADGTDHNGYVSATIGPCGQATCTTSTVGDAEFGSDDSFTVSAQTRYASTLPPPPNASGFAVSIYDANTNDQVWSWADTSPAQYSDFEKVGSSVNDLVSKKYVWSKYVPGPGRYYVQWRFGANGKNWGRNWDNAASCKSPTSTISYKPYVNFFGNDVFAGGAFTKSDGTCGAQGDGDILAWLDNAKKSGSGDQFATLAEGGIDGFGSAMMRTSAPTPITGLMFSNTNSGQLGTSHCIPDYYDTKDKLDPASTGSSFTIWGQNAGSAGKTSTNGAYESSGDLTINSPNLGSGGGIGMGKHVVIYAAGNIYITSSIIYYGGSSQWDSLDKIPSLYVIAKGNINIAPGVNQLDGVYVSQGGTINTCANSDGSHASYDDCNNQLTINGAFIDNKTNLYRTFSSLSNSLRGEYPNNSPGKCDYKYPGKRTGGDYDCAAEIFNFSPEVYLTNPAIPPLDSGAIKFDSIQSLSPVL